MVENYASESERGKAGQRGEVCASPQSFARARAGVDDQERERQGQSAVRLLVAERGVEAHHRLLLLRREHAVLQPRPQVVDPPQPAALAVPVEPCKHTDATENSQFQD